MLACRDLSKAEVAADSLRAGARAAAAQLRASPAATAPASWPPPTAALGAGQRVASALLPAPADAIEAAADALAVLPLDLADLESVRRFSDAYAAR